jgi:hypothetical protein
MKDYIGSEKAVHGQQWGAIHAGYFSDPAVARPLVETVKDILAKAPADVVVDVGGGTGYLLSQLALHKVGAGAKLVNVDCSEAQLSLMDKKVIVPVRAAIGEFRRRDISDENRRFFFIMRSVLHYSGENGLLPLLLHIRSQAKAGEFFVHQSASFACEEEADCLNALYSRMRTHKWYPTITGLKRHLAEAGWLVTAEIPAPPLSLASDDLSRRYALDVNDIMRIRDTMSAEFGGMSSVFQLTPSGFHANLHYRIYICVAAPPDIR